MQRGNKDEDANDDRGRISQRPSRPMIVAVSQ